MKNIFYQQIGLLSVLFLFVVSCSNDDIPPHIHDHDAIHELVLQRTDINGENPVEYSFIHGNEVGDIIYLEAGQTYDFEIVELNVAHDDHHHNIIDEVLEAVDEHFFLYAKSNTLNIDLIRMDDAASTQNDGTKIGLKIRIHAHDISTGNFQIVLKHQAAEVDDQANDNFGSTIGGATDVEAIFQVIIE